MLYGFAARDVARLRQLLGAYERGRVRLDAPSHLATAKHQQDSFLVYTGGLAAGALGTAYLVDLDVSIPPVQTTDTVLPAIEFYNPYTLDLAQGVYLATREPSQGYYVPTYVTPGTTQNGLTNEGPSTRPYVFTDNADAIQQITAMQLGGDSNSLWFVSYGMQGRVAVSAGGATNWGIASLSMYLQLAAGSPPAYESLENVPVAQLRMDNGILNTSEGTYDFQYSGDQCYQSTGGGGSSFPLQNYKTANTIVNGNQIVTLYAILEGGGVSVSWGGQVQKGWISAFQISPVFNYTGTVSGSGSSGGGSGGGSSSDDDSGYLTLNSTIDCGTWV